ncbi:MAG: M20 family metallopeptidase [Verrucomicrobiales bacterium]|nr:M20 family metallopeptidase [Verrucomicrobiales bacterium]
MNSVVEILQSLIRIPSVNPDGDPGTDQTGEKACAEWVGEFLKKCGATVEYEEVLPNRPNVIGRFPENQNGGPRLLFAPHLDTVSVGGMTIEPFGGEIQDGKILGRGASDTKGTMAAMLWALWMLRGRISEIKAQVNFVGLMGEETGQPGSKYFAKHHGDEFDFAIVGEPTELDVVYTHKGCLWVEITAHGVAAHGSTPERGDNAILKLNRILDAVLPELESQFKNYHDDVLGYPTVNLGMIKGGTRTNIVPDRATASLDMRQTPALQNAGGALPILESILEKNGWTDQTSLKKTGESNPLKTDPDHDEIRRFAKMGSKLVMAPWFCDAGWLSLGGIPAIACGPGSIAQAHTKDEFLKIDDLEAGAEYYKRFLETYLD